MRKVFAVAMMFVAGSFTMPVGVFAAPRQCGAPGGIPCGGVQGTATDAAKQNLPQVRVQVRPVNPAPGQGLAATGTTNSAGSFSFAGLNPGNYVVEILDAAGKIVGTNTVTVVAGSVATVSISAAAVGAIAAAGAAGVGGGLLGLGTIGTVAVVGGAVAAAVVGIKAVADNASPSR